MGRGACFSLGWKFRRSGMGWCGVRVGVGWGPVGVWVELAAECGMVSRSGTEGKRVRLAPLLALECCAPLGKSGTRTITRQQWLVIVLSWCVTYLRILCDCYVIAM